MSSRSSSHSSDSREILLDSCVLPRFAPGTLRYAKPLGTDRETKFTNPATNLLTPERTAKLLRSILDRSGPKLSSADEVLCKFVPNEITMRPVASFRR